MQSHRELKTWKAGRRLVSVIYGVTSNFPDEERFGLVAQLRRAAVSIPSNIAEGAARSSTAEYIRYLYQARGSLKELDTQLALSVDLDYLSKSEADNLIANLDDFAALLQAQINSLEQKL